MATPTQLYSLPEGWDEEQFGSLFSIQTGKAVSKNTRSGENQRPFLRTKNVFWNRLALSELDEMHFSAGEEKRLSLKSGDLLICEGGAIGRTAIWNDERERCYYQNHLHRARVLDVDATDPQFVLYWLWYGFEIGGTYLGRGNVTTIPNLSKSELSELPIPLPGLDEQQQIAKLLNLFQRAMLEQEAITALASELKSSLLDRHFGNANPSERVEPWLVSPIREFATLKSGGTPSRSRPEFWDGGAIPWVKTAEVNNCVITQTEELITPAGLKGSSARLFPAGTLLMAMYGQGVTRGKVALLDIEAATNQACVAFFPNDDVSSEYLYYLLQSRYEDLREYGHGANQKNLSAEIIGSIEIAVPRNRSRQEDAVRLMKAVDARIDVARRSREAFADLFRTTLHELMTGQLHISQFGEDGLGVAAIAAER